LILSENESTPEEIEQKKNRIFSVVSPEIMQHNLGYHNLIMQIGTYDIEALTLYQTLEKVKENRIKKIESVFSLLF
jgi:hypothetical protein